MSYVVAMETESPRTDCSRCKELDAKVSELAAEVKRLSKLVEAKTRTGKRSAAPHRLGPGRKKPEGEHLKSGRPVGHEPASKPNPLRSILRNSTSRRRDDSIRESISYGLTFANMVDN